MSEKRLSTDFNIPDGDVLLDKIRLTREDMARFNGGLVVKGLTI